MNCANLSLNDFLKVLCQDWPSEMQTHQDRMRTSVFPIGLRPSRQQEVSPWR